MATNGMLIAVRWEWDGTELSADIATGVAVLPVLDPFGLSADEVCWVGDTGPYVVASTDEDASTITLTTGITADMETGTQVPPDVGGIPSQVWVAEVVLPDAEEPIEVPLTIHDLAVMPEGEYDPPVAIEISDDYTKVIDLPGSIPIIDGGLIPPDTLPIPPDSGGSDGQVPPSSPQPDAVGGIGAFYLRWTPPPNADPMRFEVHVSDSSGFAPTATTMYTETSAYSATLRNLPWIDTNTGALAKFQYGVNYYFRIVAKDADGSAAPSLEDFAMMMQVTGPDIAARTVAGENIIGGTITGDLFAGNIILGSKISTGTLDPNGNIVGARIDLGPEGFVVYDSAGTPITAFPLDQKGQAYIRQSRLEILSADVIDNFTMHGVNNAIAASSKLTLSNAVAAPTSSPGVATFYDTVQLDTKTQFTGTGSWNMGTFPLDPSQIKNIAWHVDGYWQVVQEKNSGFRLWRFNADGSFKMNIFSGTPWHDDFKGFTRASVASNGALMFTNNGTSYMLYGGTQIPAAWIINDNQDPYLSWDPAAGSQGQFMLCQSATGSSPKTFQIRRFTVDGSGNAVNASLTTIPANFAVGRTARINGCMYLAADFGASRYVQTAEGSSSVLVFTTAVRYNTNGSYQEWTEPVASNGIGHDGINFWSVDSNGILTKYTNWTWPEYPTTTFVGMSGYDSNPAGSQVNPWPGQAAGTHETPVGLLAQITQPRRSKETITVPVTNQTTGNDDQDKWKVYWARTTGAAPTAAQMKFVATLGSTSVPQSVTLLADPVGAAPPGGIGGQTGSGNNFPAGNPARFVSAALDTGGLPLIDLRGDGAGRMGPYKWDATGKDLVKNGLMFSMSSANTNNLANATFVTVPGWVADPMATAPEFVASFTAGNFIWAVPGVYHVTARGSIGSGGAANPSRRIAALSKNGTEMARTDSAAAASNGPATLGVDVVMRIAAGDTINFQLWQNSGSGVPMVANPGHTFQAIKLSD